VSQSLKRLAFCDLDREIAVTRRVLERLPEAQFGWKPHPKSMTLGRLAMHVANLLQWMIDTIERDGLDMQKPPAMRNEPTGLADVLEVFDKNTAVLKAAMDKLDDASLTKTWTLRNGNGVLHAQPKVVIARLWCLNHLIHHRAQLCVLLRLLNVPVPAVYFNSADEPDWKFE
jgi:uncharacterized damage-inducible protein DinB